MCRSARSELVAPKLTSDSIGSVPMRFLNACRRGKLLVGGSTASVHPRAGEKSAYEDGPVGAEQADGIGVMAKVLPVLGSGRKRCVERWLMVDGERLWLVSGSQQCQSENRRSAAQFRIDLTGPMALSVGSRRESERASERAWEHTDGSRLGYSAQNCAKARAARETMSRSVLARSNTKARSTPCWWKEPDGIAMAAMLVSSLPETYSVSGGRERQRERRRTR